MVKIMEYILIMIYILFKNNILYTDIKFENILIDCLLEENNIITINLLLCDIGGISHNSSAQKTYSRKKQKRGDQKNIGDMIISIIHMLTTSTFILNEEFYKTDYIHINPNYPEDNYTCKQSLQRNEYNGTGIELTGTRIEKQQALEQYEQNIIKWLKLDNQILYQAIVDLYTNIPETFNDLYDKIVRLRQHLESI